MTDDYSAEREAIAQFCAREGWPVPHEALVRQTDAARESWDDALGRLRTFTTGWGAFTVSSRLHVVRWQAPETHAEASQDAGVAAAREVASAFLLRQAPAALDTFKPVSESRLGSRYKFLYEQLPPAGAVSIFYNLLSVAVQGAAVRAYQHEDLERFRTKPVAFDEAAARARVQALSGGVGLDRAFVSEKPSERGTRWTTVWEIEVFHEEGPAGILRRPFCLDADTGEPCDSDGRPLTLRDRDDG